MIITLMNQKRGLNRFSKLPDDEDPRASNNLLKHGAKEKHQLNPGAIIESGTRTAGLQLKKAA